MRVRVGIYNQDITQTEQRCAWEYITKISVLVFVVVIAIIIIVVIAITIIVVVTIITIVTCIPGGSD